MANSLPILGSIMNAIISPAIFGDDKRVYAVGLVGFSMCLISMCFVILLLQIDEQATR